MANYQSFQMNAMVLEHFDDLIGLISDQSPDKLEYLSYCAILRFEHFMRRGNQEDLEEANQKCREVVAITAEDDQSFAGRLNNLGNMICSRYERKKGTDGRMISTRRFEQHVERQTSNERKLGI